MVTIPSSHKLDGGTSFSLLLVAIIPCMMQYIMATYQRHVLSHVYSGPSCSLQGFLFCFVCMNFFYHTIHESVLGIYISSGKMIPVLSPLKYVSISLICDHKQ